MTSADQGPQPRTAPVRPHGALGVLALSVAIFAILGAFMPLINFLLGPVLGIIALALASAAMFSPRTRKLLPAIALPLAAIGVLLGLVLPIIYMMGWPAFWAAVTGTPLPVATHTPTPTPEPVLGSVPSHPAPAGTAIDLVEGGQLLYRVQLGAVMLDATEAVLAAGTGAPPPEPGYQYALAPVTLTYRGDSVGLPLAEVRIVFLAADGSSFSNAEFVEVTPEPRFGADMLRPGESVTGNILVQLPAETVGTGVWAVHTLGGAAVYLTAD